MPKSKVLSGTWERISDLTSIRYTCGWCGNLVAPDKGWHLHGQSAANPPLIQICCFCKKPTLWMRISKGAECPGGPDASIVSLSNIETPRKELLMAMASSALA